MLVDAVECFDDCNIPVRQAVKVMKMVQANLCATVDGVTHMATLRDVYNAKEITRNFTIVLLT